MKDMGLWLLMILTAWPPGVDFINSFAPLCPTFAPYAQLLRSFLLAQKWGARRKRWGQGAKPFMKSTPASPGGPRLCAPFYTWRSPSLKEVTCRMSIKHTFSATCFTVLAGAGLAPWSKQIDPGLYFDLASFNVNLNLYRLCLRSCKFFCQNFRWNLNFFKN